jgi:acyl carrier protein phosphodiesterase
MKLPRFFPETARHGRRALGQDVHVAYLGTVNFLAHLWLADQSETSLAGAVLGDWVHGRLPDHYPPELRLGIALHRHIDVTTDAHAVMVSAREQFAQGSRRYAGILLDLLADHALAQRWDEFSAESLAEFAQRGAQAIGSHAEWFLQAGNFAPSETEFKNLLLSYATAEGLDRAIQRTAQRLRKPEGLLAAAHNWPSRMHHMEPRLPELLMDLREAATTFVSRSKS